MGLSAISAQQSANSLFLKPFADSGMLKADSVNPETLVFG